MLTPDQARQRAKEELGKVARGDDVSQARKEKREKLTSLTFADAAKRYLDLPTMVRTLSMPLAGWEPGGFPVSVTMPLSEQHVPRQFSYHGLQTFCR